MSRKPTFAAARFLPLRKCDRASLGKCSELLGYGEVAAAGEFLKPYEFNCHEGVYENLRLGQGISSNNG